MISIRPREIVIFMLNGATYEESRFVSYLNEQNPDVNIVLGSNFIHNNRRYPQEI
jgi:vacuolar protein sorting-associated protein 45